MKFIFRKKLINLNQLTLGNISALVRETQNGMYFVPINFLVLQD
jgi:hypothetical protein